MRVLCTGLAGFLGSHVCEYLLRSTDWDIIGLIRLNHSGNLNRLAELPSWTQHGDRVRLVHHDLRSAIGAQLAQQIGPVDIILHVGASTHVDRSISDPMSFVMDNVIGTANILEYARTLDNLQWFYFQSTDEVFGRAPEGVFYHEWDRYCASNPYSASKAGAEELCISYYYTYNLPILICHTMNLIGIRQHKEKYCPSTIYKILHDEEVQVHAYPDLQKAGSRFYLDCYNLADGIMFLLKHGDKGDKYNIIGDREIDNLQLAQQIAEIIGKPLRYRMVDAHSQRKGHDPRYALSMEKINNLGWKPPVDFDTSLENTVRWYMAHPEWLIG